jgi:hypothetical protein
MEGQAMITFRITADIKDDRRVVLTLPPEVPTGQAEIVVSVEQPAAENKPTKFGLRELRRVPREQRQAILAAAAELAEEDYRSDKELTGFQAFSEEELDDGESDSLLGRGMAN